MNPDDEPKHHYSERACDHCGWPLGDDYIHIVRDYHRECVPELFENDPPAVITIGIAVQGFREDLERFWDKITSLQESTNLVVEKVSERELHEVQNDAHSDCPMECIFLDGVACVAGNELSTKYLPNKAVKKNHCYSEDFGDCPRFVNYMKYLSIRRGDC